MELMAAGRQDGQVTRQLVSAVTVRVRMRIRLGGSRALVRALAAAAGGTWQGLGEAPAGDGTQRGPSAVAW
jgi:hypothetical protein